MKAGITAGNHTYINRRYSTTGRGVPSFLVMRIIGADLWHSGKQHDGYEGFLYVKVLYLVWGRYEDEVNWSSLTDDHLWGRCRGIPSGDHGEYPGLLDGR